MKIFCKKCGSANVRVWVDCTVVWKAANGVLVPVEGEPQRVTMTNMIWDSMIGECQDCDAPLSSQQIAEIAAGGHFAEF